MKSKNIVQVIVVLCTVWTTGLITHAYAGSELDAFILTRMNEAKIPGFAACIVKNGKVQWTKGYGWADVESKTPVTSSTIFWLASISKVVTATALMQLHEERRFGLDDDVNQYLPFPVRNPKHPNAPITFRQVLTHTSSISTRRNEVLHSIKTNGDLSLGLGVFLEHFFVPEGRYYSEDNFYQYNPGKRWNYSSFGFSLAGYLVEQISQVPFDQYCKKRIFEPLEMRKTSWFYRELDPTRLAKGYRYDRTNEAYIPVKTYDYPTYPMGALCSSAKELANFLIAHIQRGRFNGIQVLKEKTANDMRRAQFPEIAEWQGLSFFLFSDANGQYVSHGGGGRGLGTKTVMLFRVEDGTGVIMLGNRYTENKAWEEIRIRLFDEAERY